MADWLRGLGWRFVKFLTCWVDEDPEPGYSDLDRADGLAAWKFTDQYEGFRGCTDRNPDTCACATHEDPECEVCGEVIADGLMMTTVLRWTYPLLPFDHPEQSHESHHAHADCMDGAV